MDDERINSRLEEELVGRASDAALETYDAAVDKDQTQAEASLAARKVYDDILAPWGL